MRLKQMACNKTEGQERSLFIRAGVEDSLVSLAMIKGH